MNFINVEVNSKRWLSLENLLNEEWKDIKDFEGIYQVSNYGRIKRLILHSGNKSGSYSKNKKTIKKPYIMNNGYYRVDLWKNNIRKACLVHNLVADAFLLKIKDKPIINHIDGNKLNNNINNLERCDYSENIIHAYNTGLRKRRKIK